MLPQTEIHQAAQEALDGIDTSVLPINPIEIARNNDIQVIPSSEIPQEIDGFIVRIGDDFAIGYRSTIPVAGRISFTIGHELGHYFLPEHCQILCPTDGSRHDCRPESSANEKEVEADRFASELLMPTNVFCQKMGTLDRTNGGLGTIKKLTEMFATSLTATANKYAQQNDAYCIVIGSDNERIKYAFLSDPLKEKLEGMERFLKDKPLPSKALARKIPIGSSGEDQRICCLDEWINGAPEIEFSEEVIGLGQFGRILTVVYSDDADWDSDGDTE